MTNQTPDQPSLQLQTYAAIAGVAVVMAVIVTAVAAVFILGGTNETAALAPSPSSAALAVESALPSEAASPVAEQAQVALAQAQAANSKVDGAEAEAPPAEEAVAPAAEALTQDPLTPAPQTQGAPAPEAEAETEAPAPATPAAETEAPSAPEAEAAPAPAAPAPVLPAPVRPLPQPVRPTCAVSKTNVDVGETFLITGTHVPSSVNVSWSFDHGDGYVDHRNPSHAFYEEAGTYTVTGIANVDGTYEQRVHCGTVTATDNAPFTIFCSIDETNIPVNGQTVFRAWSDTDLPLIYTFDHGDGYSETANPSYATYHAAGTYRVTLEAMYNGGITAVDCGSVTVYERPTQDPCPTTAVIGLHEAAAHLKIEAANCSPLTVIRGFDQIPHPGDYRTDRVKLVVDLFGIVQAAAIG